MSYLAIDFGTSSCRASIVSRTGTIISHSKEPIAVSIKGIYAEIDTDYVWDSVVRVISHEIMKNPDEEIDAVGISSMLGYVFLDGDNKPIRPAIIWMDNRATNEAAEMKQKIDENELYERTGRRITPELLAPRIMWLRRNEEGNYKKLRKIIGLKDELVRRLTGVVQTDHTHLNYSLLYNINSGEIDEEITSVLDIRRELFPKGQFAYEISGHITKRSSLITGLKEGISVISGSTDGTTAMYGGGILENRKAVLVSGTTDVLMMLTSQLRNDPSHSLSFNNGMLPGSYAAGGAMGMTGGTLKWILDLCNRDFHETVDEVKNIQPGALGLMFTPGLSGERAPYWAENFMGSLVGLNINHQPGHMVRALFEGASFRISRLLGVMRDCNLDPESINVVGGGAEIEIYNQIRADVTGYPVFSLEHTEATSLGTAVFCRKGIEDVLTLKEASDGWIIPKKGYYPEPELHEKYIKLAKIFNQYIENTMDIQNSLKVGLEK